MDPSDDDRAMMVGFALSECVGAIAVLHRSTLDRPWWKFFSPINFDRLKLMSLSVQQAANEVVVRSLANPGDGTLTDLADLVSKCAHLQGIWLGSLAAKAAGDRYDFAAYQHDLKSYELSFQALREAMRPPA